MLDLIARAEERLDATVAAMTDAQAGEPSLLPGWTRAMVVTHVARNASSNAAMIDAALRGEERDQYPGGMAEREAQIEAGRGRTAAEVLADHRESAAELARVLRAVGDDQWDVTVPAGVGRVPIGNRVRIRYLEIEAHHADLGLGYTFRDWPPEFVAAILPHVMALTPLRRSPKAQPGRWALGSWTVSVGDDVVVTEDGNGDGAVTGPAVGLLAWLMGRASLDEAGLAVHGDPAVAEFAGWFPFP
jgi:maleylpyruvate isomerase